jgi:hypothetical protein
LEKRKEDQMAYVVSSAVALSSCTKGACFCSSRVRYLSFLAEEFSTSFEPSGVLMMKPNSSRISCSSKLGEALFEA